MLTDRDFKSNKKNVMQKFDKALLEKQVDYEIIPILKLINSYDDFYTSSSCYGRIVLLEIPNIGDKKNAKWLGKWHSKITLDDILISFNFASKGQLWVLAQSPIIHVYSKNQDAADKLIKAAISCGFKHSGFKSIEKNIVLEIASTERLDAPIGNDGHLYCSDDYINLIVKISNDIIHRSVEKLNRFHKFLLDNF